MIAWPFIAFAVIFLMLVCAHFIFAYRAWRTSRGEQSQEIDPNYVRLEDYFARSFRVKVAEWLQLPVHGAMPPGIRIILKGRERIRISGSSMYPPQSKLEDILIVQGSLECGPSCTFNSEIYVKENARIGAQSELQSIAADGNLVLEDGVQVTRWADSSGDLEIGPNALVRVRATAGTTIRMCEGAQVGCAFAPTVRSGHGEPDIVKETTELPVLVLEIPRKKTAEQPAANPGGEGFAPDKLRMLSPDCWMYAGDLKPPAPLRVTTKLIVKGDCIIPGGSILEGDLKADGQVEIGPRSVCRGSVIAGGTIRFGAGSRFDGVVHAGKELWLGSGVSGGDEDARVAAYAAETVRLECGVVVHGKLASADHVEVTSRSAPQ